MASVHEDQAGPETVAENKNLLENIGAAITAKQCCDNFCFLLVTILLVADIVTDIWVIVIYGMEKHTLYMAVAALFMILSAIFTSVLFSAQMRTDGEGEMGKMYICLCCNFPLQIGIIYQRCLYGFHRCARQSVVHTHGRPTGTSNPCNLDWKFAKLKLVQSMFQCAPELLINLLHMLLYAHAPVVQIVSAVTSFASLVLGIVLHEKARKDHARGSSMGVAKIACIFAYKTLVLATRIVAMTNFMHFFTGWIAAILIPHCLLVFAFFSYLYRQVWKVPYYKIVQHALYSTLAYFPIHNEYRPEGEIVIFYILFMVENIVMVAVPFKYSNPHSVHVAFAPGSKYYLGVTLGVLLGSAAALVFMSLYYFVFHKSRHSIRDTHLGWLGRLCEWSKRSRDLTPTGAAEGEVHVTTGGDPDKIYIHSNPVVNGRRGDVHRAATDDGDNCGVGVIQDGVTFISGQGRCHGAGTTDAASGSATHAAILTDTELETPSRATLLDDTVIKVRDTGGVRARLFKTGLDLRRGKGGRESVEEDPEASSRPSVLEGDDEDFDHEDYDCQPLHPTV